MRTTQVDARRGEKLVTAAHPFASRADRKNVRRNGRSGEDGFTMIEVIVALALISTMMASLSTYFVSSMRTSRYQAQVQTATRLAQSGMEQARGFGGPALLVGRAQCGTCLNVSGFDTLGYLTSTTRWDAKVTGVAPTVPLNDVAETFTVGSVVYQRYWFVGRCWQALTGGACGTTSTLPVAMVRLVVGVAWSGPDCRYRICIRAASSLFSASAADPVFPQ
ncbi:prepilin-type N-terminal cleavage/methylation domain-containing protein [Actinoplanes sp. NPDC049599]|uniref:prepilin-type N-terminal cleavage/methylation domain-containing protein n=1 Tax=Actinoplanes sp. NPDC049599 TaxID=3363903 RepID=UPI0037906F4F